jgi:hypothetical protein
MLVLAQPAQMELMAPTVLMAPTAPMVGASPTAQRTVVEPQAAQVANPQ